MSLAPSRRAFWFLAVGGTAALTHLGAFAILRDVMRPELANAGAFLIAFLVSFAGHRLLTFADATNGVSQSLVRFLVTSLAGFAVNEALFVLLLRGADWPPFAALITAQVVVAVQTYVVSRRWAFPRGERA